MPESRIQSGFSLVELMIVLVIASILAAIVYPSYRDYLIRSALPEATGGLASYAMRMDEYYQDHLSYVGSDDACGIAPPSASKFLFSCTPASNGKAYVLAATGAAGDLAEFSYTLDQQGNQITTSLPAGWGTAPANCWVQRRGAC